MKKVLLLSFSLLLFINAYSQRDKQYIYCELVGTGKLFSSKVSIQVDYGQETKFFKGKEYIKDEEGRVVNFNSMIDAMNYYGLQGWEFVQAYVVTIGNQNVYHWLLKKEIKEEDLN